MVDGNQSIYVEGQLLTNWQLTKSNCGRGGYGRNGQYGYGHKGHYGVPSIMGSTSLLHMFTDRCNPTKQLTIK